LYDRIDAIHVDATMLTLVTPSLNQVQYLRQCVASAGAQAEVAEHIVSDGGSSDGTLAFLKRAATGDRRLRYRSAPDDGMYDALNQGIAMARGDLLGYLNCDDLLLPWSADIVCRAFAAQPDADVIYGDALEQRGERLAIIVHPPPRLLGAHFRGGGHLAQPAVFFRRRLFEELGGFNPGYRLLGDHDLWLRAHASSARFVKVWECLALLRMVPGQLMEDQSGAREERQRLLGENFGGLPSASERLTMRGIYATLHRAGIVALALGRPLLDVGGAALGAPWRHTAGSGLVRAGRPTAIARALLRPSARIRYLELTGAGRAQLMSEGATEASSAP